MKDKINTLSVSAARLLYSSSLKFAREDCATFCELAMRDEETGTPIILEEFHHEWIEAANTHRYVVIWAFPESGKSQIMSVGRILWLLGRNQRSRYAILSATHEQAKKIIRLIKEHIEDNPVVHDVFDGKLRRGELWTDTAIIIDRPSGIRDPSVQAYSPEGGSIQGARLDGLVIDDVLTENNTRTSYQRKKVSDWIKASAFSRLSTDAWVVLNANAWHPEDFAHELADRGWWNMRYPVLLPDGSSAWPGRWPLDRIENVRTKIFGGSIEFERQMMCVAHGDSTARFKREWIDQCLDVNYRLYQSWEDIYDNDPELAEELAITESMLLLGEIPDGFLVITGVDIGVGVKTSNDLSSLFTILLWPNGVRQVLDVQAGRWHGSDLIQRIIAVHERYRSVMVVENNGAQDFIVQWALREKPSMMVRRFTTTARKKHSRDFGVESLAAELERRMWLIPCDPRTGRPAGEVNAWINEMLMYDPRKHTGDRLIASWIAREYARRYSYREERRSRRGSIGSGAIVLS